LGATVGFLGGFKGPNEHQTVCDAGQAAEANLIEARIDEDWDEAAEKNAGEQMEEATSEPATERFVEKKEGGGVENQVVERIVFPGEREPTGEFAFE